MLVVPGQVVKAGELLAQLDAREVKARLDQAMAVREQAEQELRRASELLKQQVASQQEFDAVQSRARVAVAGDRPVSDPREHGRRAVERRHRTGDVAAARWRSSVGR